MIAAKNFSRQHAASGLAELELPKRTDLALFKHLDRTKAPLLYHWRHDGHKILAGTPVAPPSI